MKHKGVIFDLDGTLIDTLGDIAGSMNRALTKHGFPILEKEAYREKVGWGIRKLAYLCILASGRFDEKLQNEELKKTADAVANDAVQFYSEVPLVYTKPYPGILDLVSQLRQKKIKTAVLTNKPDPTAQLVVAGLFPPGSFSIVRGEIFGKPRKPDPACVWDIAVELDLTPAEIIFVGDSEVDIETAVASGCFPLGVSWGYRSRETILKAGARQIIDKPGELIDNII